MKLIKAVHSCKKNSEEELVTGIKDGPFEFLRRWGVFAWLLNGILVIATAGVWIACILGFYLLDILSPRYTCQNCGGPIKRKNYRL